MIQHAVDNSTGGVRAMTETTPDTTDDGLVARAKAIILKPRETWPVIAREATPSGDIFTRYALPLAAIGPVAVFLGGQLFGYSVGFTFRPSIMSALAMAIGTYVMSLVGLFIVSFVADWLAPKFGGESSSRNAFKLVVYSMTASWIAGIFGLVPSLLFLGLVGLYSFYLFYLGAGPLMKVPQDKAAGYTAVTVVAVIVLYACIGALTSRLSDMVGGTSLLTGTVSTPDGGTVSLPGGGSIDTGKIEQAAKDIEAAASGQTATVAASDLQALLPASVGSYQRTSVESGKAGPASQAEGRYEADGKSFRLKVSDIAVMGAVAGMAGALGVEKNKEDADGYEKTTTVDGNLVQEKWDRSSSSGSFMTMVGKRFIVEAEGEAASIDQLKAAVATIDVGKLASLAGN